MAHALPLLSETIVTIDRQDMPVVAVIAVKFAVCVTTWTIRRRTRIALNSLDDWQLRDVGLTPRQAQIEAARAFWQP